MTDASAPVETTDNAATAPIAGAEQQPPVAETTTQQTTPTTPEAATPPVTEFEFKDWLEKQPDDMKNSPSLSKFQTWEGLSKSYVNLERMMGGDKVPVPKEGDQAAWDRFWKAAGRPDDPKGYEFAKPEKLPEGMEYSEEVDKTFATKAHELGLNKRQASALREWQLDYLSQAQTKQAEESAAAQEAAAAQLKSEWGRAYEPKLAAANKAVKEYGGAEFAAFLDQSGLGDHPALVKAFATIAEKTMGESQLVGDKVEQEPTPANLDETIASFRREHHAALHDSSHVDHKRLVAQMTRLFEQRFSA